MSLLRTISRRLPASVTSATWKSVVATTNNNANNVWFSSSADGGDDDDTSITPPEFYTGTVKFFKRQMSYGFIQPDQQDLPEVFVHREAIVCDVPASKNPFNPFLVKGERVKFQTVPGTKPGQLKAGELTYEDGLPVPLFREGFLERETTSATNQLGKQVYEILSDKEGDPTTQIEQIMIAFDETENRVGKAKEKVEKEQQEQQQKQQPEED
mmetsp:Transcript_23578/g.30757  ORF Transcript_23578/g.30757 Transcript_23578/m.30757 type:complete len:212 (-) Transcript_23578:207-842(-)|eukprot:CAMPEP_0195247588 /NCGR_PEP_ID=MMETSP0706-20130129/1062_1 /TAXON_ID=33640 /ORGANISM="Asterionellopsis glacialis, Strain CCMP134" /LENGTH=211 /DNA_ID=CAMNT_0040299133 /DNA_START=1 /DNA_END=636 /DNA_ORIENTATION=-